MNKKNSSQITKLDSIRIGLAPPEVIRKWAERILPNGKIVGEVTSRETLNHNTLNPEKGGLFCERIFGPVKDFECSCGRKKNKIQQQFCPHCEVEFTSAQVRRYRLGYIQLASPVTHVWYLKGRRPSYISILLGIKQKKIEAITYYTEALYFSNLKSEAFEGKLSLSKSPRVFSEKEKFVPNSNLETKFFSSPRTLGNDKGEQGDKPKGLKNSRFILSEKNIKLSDLSFGQKTKQINNYYTIRQNASWEIPYEKNEEKSDLKEFLNYMTSNFVRGDIPIPIYSDRINHEFTRLTTNFINPTQSDIPLTGAVAIRFLLASLDLLTLDRQIRVELFELNEEIYELENEGFLTLSEFKRLQRLHRLRSEKLRRLKLVRHFRQTKTRPEWMILSVLPVLPPDLRPIIKIDDEIRPDDLNELYQKVLDRNNRLKKPQKSNYFNQFDLYYNQLLLQNAVDALIQSGKDQNGKMKANSICRRNGEPLQGLEEKLKGKQGRFRQNLLGKRVDYSGRSVIVVGPTLKLHECGLPKQMAIELFQPFLIQRLLATKVAQTMVSAKLLIQRQDPIIWDILQQLLPHHPVLLNRAPTLHRLGIQAFQPKLVNSRAILLHPLVCPAFNADFDGDQMAVHVPLSFQARAEAWKLMWSRNNLLSPATGQPIIIPSQDMVLGCYYLTTTNSKAVQGIGQYFSDLNEVTKAFHHKKIELHTPIWIRWNRALEAGAMIEKPLEIRIDCFGNNQTIYSKYQRHFDKFFILKSQFIRATAGRVLINQIIVD